MTPKLSTRDTLLDAFESAVIERGERAATLEAVAGKAGVSKGGLLYHFGSKKDLVEGVIERITELSVDYTRFLAGSPEGVVGTFIRTSVTTGTAFDNSYIALTRLAQSGIYPEAREALARLEAEWADMIQREVGDPAVARLILLVSDGLYYNSALFPALNPGTTEPLDDVIAAIGDLVRTRRSPAP
ncbi:MAG: putative TetR-family transcriptional regulator [Microbacteriaceae bacterium]|jgi:AcrR family transcriptional regulator|nr:putative TetR-family transcriptional regulator [Mycetocola sp.]MCU1542189.1 putative TetR-family transcriptional regulator [Microbacteriaceae bacterium]